MALTEFEQALVEVKMDEFIQKNRPPVELRNELDLAYRIEDQSVILFEKRKAWNSDEIIEEPAAKTTYVKTHKEWRIYWQRADLKWHRYEPTPSVNCLEDFIDEVDEDSFACFWG